MHDVMFITGTRKGIGRFLVDHYLERGYRVHGCSRGEMEDPPDGYTHHVADVTDGAAMHRALTGTARSEGSLDILVNNAGIASMNHALLTPASTVREVFSTNVFGLVQTSIDAAKIMTQHKWGRIVNFATVATPLRLEGESAYAASKAAVVSYTEILARELATFGITVNAVGPTPVATDLIRGVPAEKLSALLSRQAIPRLGEPADVANVIDFFIADASAFVTGQTVYLGGVV